VLLRLEDLRLGDLRLEDLRRGLHGDFFPALPLHAFMAAFKEGRLPSRSLLFFLQDINLRVQERNAGDNRFDDRRLVERRLGEPAIIY